MSTRITSLKQIRDLAGKHGSVMTATGTRMPAAVMLNMQGGTILRYMEFGLYRYVKKPTKRKWGRVEQVKTEEEVVDPGF